LEPRVSLPSPEAPPVVLVIEEDLIANLIEGSLKHGGYPVVRAAHGGSVFELVRTHKPRVVILDYHTTRRTPLEVMRLLASTDREDLRVLVVAEPISRNLERAAREAGAHDFLARPFLPGDLVRRVDRLYSASAVV